MAGMKDLFTDLQEQVYEKLESIGISRGTNFEFEEIFVQRQQHGMDFQEFAEKMAGYAITIYFLSEVTGYTQEYLWSIWKEAAEDAMEDGLKELNEAWESFKQTTYEKDW